MRSKRKKPSEPSTNDACAAPWVISCMVVNAPRSAFTSCSITVST